MSVGNTIADKGYYFTQPPVSASDARIAQADAAFGFGAGHAAWLDDAKLEFEAIEQLSEGWDCDGALPPNPAVINGGISLLESLAEMPMIPKPFINPTRNGGVQFEWEVGPRYFEIDVVSPGAAAYFFQDKTAQIEAEGQVFVEESLEDVVRFIWRVTWTD